MKMCYKKKSYYINLRSLTQIFFSLTNKIFFLMGDVILFYFFQNVIMFCALFWFLMVLGEYFYKKKVQIFKNQIYECGFKSLNDLDLHTNFTFVIFAGFLVLYDVEFMFLIPLVFNIQFIAASQFIVILIFFILFLFSLLYDWQMSALNWQI